MALRDLAITDLDTLKTYISQKPLPAHTVQSLTSSGVTASASTGALVAGHGYTTGQRVTITGALQPEYNGTYPVTVTGMNTFTYEFAGSATSPATGSIKCRGEDTTTDQLLTLIANGVSAWIERETAGHVFKARTVTEQYRSLGRTKLFLRRIPVLSITSIVNESETIPASDYQVERPDLGLVSLLNGRSSFGVSNGLVTVTYVAGYDEDVNGVPIPDDAVLLCLELSKVALDELKNGAISTTQVTSGTSTIRSRSELDPRQAEILAGLKDVRF